MVRGPLFATALLIFCTQNALAQDPPAPAITGYVTRFTSQTDFDVNGIHIICNAETLFSSIASSTLKHTSRTPGDHYVGQPMDVFGSFHKKTHSITASEVVAHVPQPERISGTAIIDRIPDPVQSTPNERLLRADGYLILITPATQTTFTAPLDSLADVGTNVWLKYSGKQRPDGVIEAETAAFKQNVVPKSEDKLRTNLEYDPTDVDPSIEQSAISKYFLGEDPRKIPPYDDAAMQVRIDRIGARLVPAYQRELPDTDPTKIIFRFQIVDEPKWHEAMMLPNGIILVSRQVVQRMQNDSQIATVLADGIARALEKQVFRELLAVNATTAAKVAAFVVPWVGAPAYLTSDKIRSTILLHAEEQRARVSLCLLHDAGYNISEAPRVWWLLVPKKPKDTGDIVIPDRAIYLYQEIGTTWRSAEPATPSTATASAN
jgi:hypothetical protein